MQQATAISSTRTRWQVAVVALLVGFVALFAGEFGTKHAAADYYGGSGGSYYCTTGGEGCTQQQVDSDLDGVCNSGVSSSLCQGSDSCPRTLPGAVVDKRGCSQRQVDSDLDGVCNSGVSSSLCYGSDSCPRYPAPGTTNGCPGGAAAVECQPVVRWEAWSFLNQVVAATIFVPADYPAVTGECGIFLSTLQGDLDVGPNSFVYIRSSTVNGDILLRGGATIAFDYTNIYGNINCEPGGVVWFYGNNHMYGQISPTCEVHP